MCIYVCDLIIGRFRAMKSRGTLIAELYGIFLWWPLWGLSNYYTPCYSTLVEIMACRLFSDKLLPEAMMTYCVLGPQEQTSVEFESKYKLFLTFFVFQNAVRKMVAILFRSHFNKWGKETQRYMEICVSAAVLEKNVQVMLEIIKKLNPRRIWNL